jgi:hypothetical protein
MMQSKKLPSKKVQALLWFVALLLVSNFILLRIFGNALRSTYLFITRDTVFYPIAFVNLISGILLLAWLVYITVASGHK